MKQKVILSASGVFLFLLFVLFSYLVHRNHFTQFDFDTTVKIQDHVSRRLDDIFSFFSLIGSVEIISVFLVIFLIVKMKLKGIVVLAMYAAIHFFELFGKMFVIHPGPPFMFFRYDINFFFPSSYVQPGSSYPSGHSARAAFISIVVLLVLLRTKKVSNFHKLVLFGGAVLFDLIMFTSRVYLGEHWTSDVIGGAILGASLGLISVLGI